ncbi:hypothetical protein FGADI_11584 [Fusarium gaditjirri]|uniref:Uncharacterized protein n=1 Tax=Fusarium gaditjirri TaxID=282569 RepID=A0A8H4SUC2_9HYPO|nr:hypothetical protein FGADI_11584 [Fusarium gaditjirri]
MSTIPPTSSADLPKTFTSKWLSLISASRGSSPHGTREGLEERANEIPTIDHTEDEATALDPSLVEAANNSAMPLSIIRRLLDPKASVTKLELDQISQAYVAFKPREHNLQQRIQELVNLSVQSPGDNPDKTYEMNAEPGQISQAITQSNLMSIAFAAGASG